MLQSLLDRLLHEQAAGQSLAYTALVETRGSTPQKPGARMLVFPNGSQLGTLGGGCVEAEVKRRALELQYAGGGTQLLTFHLDGDYGWDDGLICGGRMTMLIDPLGPAGSANYYQQLKELLPHGCTEVTLLEALGEFPAGARFLFDAAGVCRAQQPAGEVPAAIIEELRPLAGRPRAYQAGQASYVPLLPRVPLYIVGAGHVGEKVAEFAAQVDFDVIVIDDREHYCNPTRFPQAQQCLVGPIEDVLAGLKPPESAFFIIVTRGHQHDEQALYHLISKPHTYLGMIGSKRKIRLIYEDLQRQGISAAALQRVHAPLGLPIGSQTVPEIAISIVAELIACRNLGETKPPTLASS
jgi:xanthine dehydrogenase accessory factor